MVKFRLFFYKDSNNSSVKSCLMYKKHQITALDSKDVLFLGYTFFFNKLKNFDIKDTEGQTYKTNVSRESRLQQWLVTTGSDKHHTD